MTEDDRVPVPGNGHVRNAEPTPDPGATGSPAIQGRAGDDLSMAFSPRQLVIGFGILAALIALIAGRARRGPHRG